MKVNFENTYEHIGYLLYASACGQATWSTAQLVKLTDLIERIWQPESKGDQELHLHLVDCIHAGVTYVVDNKVSNEHALSSFHGYYQVHALSFSPALLQKIVSSVMTILSEFPDSRGNEPVKKELEYLMSVIPVSDD